MLHDSATRRHKPALEVHCFRAIPEIAAGPLTRFILDSLLAAEAGAALLSRGNPIARRSP